MARGALLLGGFGLGLVLCLVGLLLLVDVIVVGVASPAACAQRCFGNGDCCTVWDGACWRGRPDGRGCRKESVALPAVLVAVGGALTLGGLIWFAVERRDP